MRTLITILLICLTFMSYGQLKFDSTTNLVSGNAKFKFIRATMTGGRWGSGGSGNYPANSSLRIRMNKKGTGKLTFHFGNKLDFDITHSKFSNGKFEFNLKGKNNVIKTASLTTREGEELTFILIDETGDVTLRVTD